MINGDRPRVLDSVAATVWRHDHLAGAALVESVVAAHGPSDEAVGIVATVAATLKA